MHKKFLGQHFLHDSRILERIVGLIAPEPSDYLVEIGPGEGALTARLLPLVHSMDVIELDCDVIPKLKNNCNNSENLRICMGDVLQVDFAQFPRLHPGFSGSASIDPSNLGIRLGGKERVTGVRFPCMTVTNDAANNAENQTATGISPLRLVGNLPYNISTPLLFKAIESISLIKDMHFMLQKEVAERIVASAGSKIYGRLSVMVQYYCEVELLLHVGSGAFSPPPKVSSAFIRLIPRRNYSIVAQDEKLLCEVVRAAFCQRRKIISNGLKKYIIASQLEEIGINPMLRPEQLQVDEFVRISNKLSA